MGQYYVIANVDKKQFLHPHRYDNGMKLMEWSYKGNRLVNTLLNLMMGDWKGDRVYVVGDYADMSNADEVWYQTYKELADEFGIKDGNYQQYPDEYSLHAYAEAHFEHVDMVGQMAANTTARFLVNRETEQVIDLEKCPADNYGYTIAPISLLLAMGNDRGGGDFPEGNQGYEHVGEWVSTSDSIEVWECEPPFCEGYAEFQPDFLEGR